MEQEANFDDRSSQVVEELTMMNRRQRLGCFDFDDHAVGDQKVGPKMSDPKPQYQTSTETSR